MKPAEHSGYGPCPYGEAHHNGANCSCDRCIAARRAWDAEAERSESAATAPRRSAAWFARREAVARCLGVSPTSIDYDIDPDYASSDSVVSVRQTYITRAQAESLFAAGAVALGYREFSEETGIGVFPVPLLDVEFAQSESEGA